MTKDEIFEEVLDNYLTAERALINEFSSRISEDEIDLEEQIQDYKKRYYGHTK
jgi:hypothetical protein